MFVNVFGYVLSVLVMFFNLSITECNLEICRMFWNVFECNLSYVFLNVYRCYSSVLEMFVNLIWMVHECNQDVF